jgi:hypothetical protein
MYRKSDFTWVVMLEVKAHIQSQCKLCCDIFQCVNTLMCVCLTIWHAGIYDYEIVCSPNKMKSDVSNICVWEELWIGIMYFLAHRIPGSHSGIVEDSGLLGCKAVSLKEYFPKFWRTTVPSSSGCSSRSIPRRLRDPEDEGIVILQNNGNFLPNNTVPHPRSLTLHFSACLQSTGAHIKTTLVTCTYETNWQGLNRFSLDLILGILPKLVNTFQSGWSKK